MDDNYTVDEAAEEAALEAGFTGPDGTPPAPPEENTTITEPPVVSDAPAVPEPEPAKQLSMDDVTAALTAQKQDHQRELQKIQDKVFGKVGELQQRIDALKNASSGLSPKAKERLKKDFSELHDMLYDEDDQEPSPPPAAAAPVYIPVPQVEDSREEWQKDPIKVVERRLLTRDHKDWESIVGSPDFLSWKNNVLPADDSTRLDTVWDADFISAKFTEFKAWKAAQAAAAVAQQNKKNRLDNAVTPRGVPRQGTSSLSDDDEELAMEQAFQARK